MSAQVLALCASELLDQYGKAALSATAVVEVVFDQIERLDRHIHAWAHLDRARALSQAARVDASRRAGKPVGRLAGVPIGIKDVFNTLDMPCQMGSPIWKGFMPGNDARVVHYMRMEDAVFPGKTVTAEFAVHAPGPTRNPHHPRHMPGTSSSGSAAAVAAFMAPLAIGTQTAGSIIRPASYCGVYGFKPSFGLLPRTGMLKTTDSLDTVGLFARSVEDLSLLFDILRVRGKDYPVSETALADPARRTKPAQRPWRVALVRGPKWNDAEDYAQRALVDFAKQLGQRGDVVVEEPTLPEGFDRAHGVHSRIYDRALAYYFKEEFKNHTLISEVMYEIITHGNTISLDDYQAAQDEQATLAARLDEMLRDRFDVILDLSTGGEAKEGLDSHDRPDNCLIWTLCGVPAISLPVFRGPKGLPFGAQVVGRRFSDYRLLDFAGLLQARQLVGRAPYPTPALVFEGHNG